MVNVDFFWGKQKKSTDYLKIGNNPRHRGSLNLKNKFFLVVVDKTLKSVSEFLKKTTKVVYKRIQRRNFMIKKSMKHLTLEHVLNLKIFHDYSIANEIVK